MQITECYFYAGMLIGKLEPSQTDDDITISNSAGEPLYSGDSISHADMMALLPDVAEAIQAAMPEQMPPAVLYDTCAMAWANAITQLKYDQYSTSIDDSDCSPAGPM